MLANICVEHRYEVSLYRHSAFFTIILVFFLCHCPAFLVYVIVRFFLFMSFPDALLFQSLPDLIGQSIILYLVFWGYSGYAFGIFNLQNKNYLLR